MHCTKQDVVHEGRYELAGLKSNNYYGNSSFGCHQDGYDGSVVLDGETVPDASYTDLLDLLVDVENYDFASCCRNIVLGSLDMTTEI